MRLTLERLVEMAGPLALHLLIRVMLKGYKVLSRTIGR